MKICSTCKKEKELIRFRKNNHECKTCNKRYELLIDFDITLEDYNEILYNQNGCCAICDAHHTEFKKALAVDHCHETGRIRGLLCNGCNLNRVGSNTLETARKVVEYLRLDT